MKIYIPEFLKYINKYFESTGKRVYLVGGAVRNTLLGLVPSDYDISGAALVEDLYDIFADSDIKIVPIAPEFGSVQLHVQNGDKREIVEYTTFRKEVYSAGGTHRPTGVEFSDDINCDAFRRDFSINAIYADLGNGEIIDPTNGLSDIKNKLIRASSANPDIIMRDDGLRVLRLVRFASELGFAIEPKTWESSKKHARLLKDIPVERIWAEIQKILLSDAKYPILSAALEPAHFRGLNLMQELDIMRYVFAELLEGQEIVQDPNYHAYDVLNHNLNSCKFASPMLERRLAALLHDVGKPKVFLQNGEMLMHDIVGAEISRKMLERLNASNKIIDDVAYLVRWHMYDLNNIAKESTLRKKFVEMGIQRTLGFIDLRRADFLGSGKQTPPVDSSERYAKILNAMIKQKVPFDMEDLQINGNEIMHALKIQPSEKIGIIKHKLQQHCAIRPHDNNRRRLEQIARVIFEHLN